MVHRKLTITVDEEVYRELHQQVGRGNISRFIEALVRPHLVTASDMEDGYRAMASDADREQDAADWAEGLIAGSIE